MTKHNRTDDRQQQMQQLVAMVEQQCSRFPRYGVQQREPTVTTTLLSVHGAAVLSVMYLKHLLARLSSHQPYCGVPSSILTPRLPPFLPCINTPQQPWVQQLIAAHSDSKLVFSADGNPAETRQHLSTGLSQDHLVSRTGSMRVGWG